MNEDYIRKRITQLRIDRNISEYRLSYELGQSKGYIQSISSGRALPSIPMLFKICDYFDLTVTEFFTPQLENPGLLHQLNREQGKTIVLITHNQELALETDRFVTMRDGRLYVGDTGEEVRYGA